MPHKSGKTSYGPTPGHPGKKPPQKLPFTPKMNKEIRQTPKRPKRVP